MFDFKPAIDSVRSIARTMELWEGCHVDVIVNPPLTDDELAQMEELLQATYPTYVADVFTTYSREFYIEYYWRSDEVREILGRDFHGGLGMSPCRTLAGFYSDTLKHLEIPQSWKDQIMRDGEGVLRVFGVSYGARCFYALKADCDPPRMIYYGEPENLLWYGEPGEPEDLQIDFGPIEEFFQAWETALFGIGPDLVYFEEGRVVCSEKGLKLQELFKRKLALS